MTNLHQLSLNAVVEGCQDEAQQRRELEIGHCFELFRRAIEEQQHLAWEAVIRQYNRLLYSWLYSRTFQSFTPEEKEDLIQEAWAKFWKTLKNYGIPLKSRFKHVGALLNYLKKCLITTTIDYQRRLARKKRLQKKLEAEPQPVSPATEASVIARLSAEAEALAVREWITKHVTDKKELLVLRYSFEQGLKPSEIINRHPELFSNIQTIYRIKERVLKRARRYFE